MLTLSTTRKIFSPLYTHSLYSGSPLLIIASIVINAYGATVWYFYHTLTLVFLLATYNTFLFFMYKRSYRLLFLLNTVFAGVVIFNAWSHHTYNYAVKQISGPIDNVFATVIDSVQEHDVQKLTLNLHAPYGHTIRIHTRQKCPEIGPSHVLHIKKLYIRGNTNKNFQRYLEKEGMHALVHTKKLDYSIIGTHHSIITRLRQQLHRIEQNLQEKMSHINNLLLKRLFLGWPAKGNFDTQYDKAQKLFNNWGIDHFLARSGLHVSLLVFLLSFCCLNFIPNMRVKSIISCFL